MLVLVLAEAQVDVEAAVLTEDAKDGAGLGYRWWGGRGLLSLGRATAAAGVAAGEKEEHAAAAEMTEAMSSSWQRAWV